MSPGLHFKSGAEKENWSRNAKSADQQIWKLFSDYIRRLVLFQFFRWRLSSAENVQQVCLAGWESANVREYGSQS